MQHLDVFVLIERCYLQQNCASVPDDSPAICLRTLGLLKRLDRVGGSDGVLKGVRREVGRGPQKIGHVC